ncbi:tRNA N6-adenosine threonylcarbamoyltransferase [Elysia marginata]|uniref:tRNA N6-adenosine threonylcarbamoyltransferase n=1 Tax=Elysia marginata TaxID=1093978 RepID=A0AAV4GAB6_9GAST|nr:tRNA N6-adenosine threonylcarbamoyltransferase [Elysia marginata]
MGGDRELLSIVYLLLLCFCRKQNYNSTYFFCLCRAQKVHTNKETTVTGLSPDTLLPQAADICAWFQNNLLYHIARRLQRAFIYTEMYGMCGPNKTLVLSGGVASNLYIRAKLSDLCSSYGYRLVCPPQKLCTDNGIMIAWNGMEKLLSGRNFFQDPDSTDVEARSPLGTDISKAVSNSSIRLPKLLLDAS